MQSGMELRNHPGMRWHGQLSWPPEWVGPHGPDRPLPLGEVGVLLRVVPSASVSSCCILEMYWNDQIYVGSLFFDDPDFLKKTCNLLQSRVGCPISEVGSLSVI